MADFSRLSEGEQKRAATRVGRAGILVVESTFAAVKALEPIRMGIADAVEQSSSVQEADDKVVTFLLTREEDTTLGDAIFVPMLQADMAAQLMVHAHEAKTVQLTAQAAGAFLDLPWTEAIADFKARGVLTEKGFQELISDYASRSQEARQLMLRQLRLRTRELLVRALEEGDTFRQFAAGFRETAQGLGITAENPAYLNMVFRTNIQSAYGAGRFRAITDPDVMQARPFIQYRTVGDSRVRDAHAVLEDTVYRTDSADWRRIAPPNGFSCRCSATTLDREEASKFTVLDEPPADYVADPNFDAPPVSLLKRSIT